MTHPWTLVYEGFEPAQEGLREALCTLGNGYFATRGAAPQSHADGTHYPGTYLAGGYNRRETEVSGRTIENEDLVNLPNWLCLTFRFEQGDWFSLEDVEILRYRQELDLYQGILNRTVVFKDDRDRKAMLQERRVVHMGEPHLAALELRITPENWSGALEIRTALDGRVKNEGVERYQGLNNDHLVPLSSEPVDEDTLFLKVETNQSGLRVAQAARTRAYQGGHLLRPERRLVQEEGWIAQEFSVRLESREELRLEKVLALCTSRDHASSECGLEARKLAARSDAFEGLLRSHSRAWSHLWRDFDMVFEHRDPGKSDLTAMILRLNIFHLLQTASTHTMDMDVGIPSRGWHGEAYRGHIFWDELFIFPFLNLRLSEITRSLILYRYRRLNEARAAARAEGYRGAMYPWQSGSNGREESQKLHLNPKSGRWIPDNSRRQRHVNAAIAYNVVQYYQITGDREFFSTYGAEMLLEIARFWADIAEFNEERGRYEIRGVMGPDEYHDGYPWSDEPGLNNNAYTNFMAAWVLTEALDLLDILPQERARELQESLGLEQEELARWDDVSRRLCVVFQEGGIISQFEGYDDLEEFDWEGYREKYEDIQRLDRILEAEDDTPNRYKASKQADVLMLFYLFSAEELKRVFDRLGYDFDPDTIPRNIRYYIQRTSHGSTLSRMVHSSILGRASREESWPLFESALKSDYTDIQGGTTPEGIHLGAMAGSVNILLQTYTDIEACRGVLRFNPRLPKEMGRLSMNIRYRCHTLHVDVTQERLVVTAGDALAEPIRIGFRGEEFELASNQPRTFEL